SALEAARQQTEFLERPVLAGAAGERMDDGETVARDVAMDARDRVGAAVRNRLHLFQVEIRGVYWRALRRQGGEELEWQLERANQVAEFRAVGAIPGDDRIEVAELGDEAMRRRVHDAQQVETGGGDGTRRVGEAHQWHVGGCGPDLQIVCPQAFESG